MIKKTPNKDWHWRYLLLIPPIVLSGLAFVLSSPAVSLLLLLGTFGLALPVIEGLVPLATLAWSYVPLVLFWPLGWLMRIAAVAAGVAFIYWINFYPHAVANQQADQFINSFQQRPAQPNNHAAEVHSVEIRRTVAPNPNLEGQVFGADICDRTCVALLQGGQVENVFIRLKNDLMGNQHFESLVEVKLAGPDQCKLLHSEMPDGQSCVTFTNLAGEQSPNLVLDISEDWLNHLQPEAAFNHITVTGSRGVEARFLPSGDIAFQRSQTLFEIPGQWLVIDFGRLGGTDIGKGGFTYIPEESRSADIDIVSELAMLGIKMGPKELPSLQMQSQSSYKDAPTPAFGAMVHSLLLLIDSNQSLPYSQGQLLLNWLDHARNIRDFEGSNLEILCHIKKIAALKQANYSLNFIFQRNPTVKCP